MGLSKTHKRLIRKAETRGGRVIKKAKGLMIYGPDGSAMIHTTTSDKRALANARADLRRAGLKV